MVSIVCNALSTLLFFRPTAMMIPPIYPVLLCSLLAPPTRSRPDIIPTKKLSLISSTRLLNALRGDHHLSIWLNYGRHFMSSYVIRLNPSCCVTFSPCAHLFRFLIHLLFSPFCCFHSLCLSLFVFNHSGSPCCLFNCFCFVSDRLISLLSFK